MEAAEEAAADVSAEEAERAAARARQRAAEAEEEEAMMEEEDDGLTKMPQKIGKRKIIHHTLDPSLLQGGVGGGAIVADAAELERRKARAAKFEVPLNEVKALAPEQMLTM